MVSGLPVSIPLSSEGSRVVVIEAAPGNGRKALLEEIRAGFAQRDTEAWLLDCDLRAGGPWAGVRDFFHQLYPELRASHPELVTTHDYELVMIAPWLRREITPRNNTLTDEAMGEEKVRNFPLDRAFRLVHGAIDLIDAWRRGSDGAPWLLLADGFDHAGALPRRFFHDLLRRRGEALGLTLVAAVDPGQGDRVAEQLEDLAPVIRRTVSMPAEEPETLPREEARSRALALEAEVGSELVAQEIHFPELLSLWRAAGDAEKARRWEVFWLGISNHRGFYEDSLHCFDSILDYLDTTPDVDPDLRWNVVGNLFHGLTTNDQVEEARRLVEEQALAKLEDPRLLVRAYYVMAILHSRHLPQHDLERAESYLEQALEMLEWIDVPEDVRHFQTVFMGNGLALVRHRQGRPEEAIRLCREGFERLEAHLSPGQHRLHRSVLLYNIAQVYAAVGAPEEAIAYHGKALEMDPNYSEYYNERGGLLLKLGRLEEAKRNFETAIELSPPYPEVWANLGQCRRRMGDVVGALDAYDRALDLEPEQQLALVGRAQTHETLGHRDAALADYTAALALDPDQPMLLANRAVLHYQGGRLEASLADLDDAIGRSPDTAALYRNRSVALEELGRLPEAVRDLQKVLELAPDAADRSALEGRLQSLENKAVGVGD